MLLEMVGVVLCGLLVRFLVSVASYSGQGQPPMFGDYEAQRHWQEVTYQLPPSDWYHNTTANDLQYWGLDYPPLTAYHSVACGALAHHINPQWVELAASRGFEGAAHKLFMRYSVIIPDLAIYFPATILYHTEQKHLSLLALLYPGLILIDHGHFQYNCISLGLFLWSVIMILRGRELWASVLFCLALNYKQMELYHATPIFLYLLANTWRYPTRLLKISLIVLLTFLLCWLPFLTSISSILQVLHRLFPVARGVYEDKVANVWCSLSVLIKLKHILSQSAMALLSLISTLLMLLPSSYCLLRSASKQAYVCALINSSLTFFLFSFQVHEKSILLAAVPASLLLSHHFSICSFFLFITSTSMFPLLYKDGLCLQYFALQLMFYLLCQFLQDHTPPPSPQPSSGARTLISLSYAAARLFPYSATFSLVLSVCHMVVPPPSRFPDIFPLLISAYCCAHFLAFLVYFNILQIVLLKNENMLEKMGKKIK